MVKNRKLSRKEQDQLQKLKNENSKLKKQIGSLRKQLDRMDLDNEKNYHIRKIAEMQYDEAKRTKLAQKLRDRWKCFQCGKGHLRIVIIPHPITPVYFRSCTICKKRTKTQTYKEGIEGLTKEDLVDK